MAIKTVYNIKHFNYIFDSKRKGAKYQWYDTVKREFKWGNAGDFFEVADKFAKGYEPHKDPSGRYDDGSDIEETHTSCKSWDFTLAPIKGNTFEEIVTIYWNTVASTNFDFGWMEGEELIVYNMNADEFNQFLQRFGRYTKDRKVVRGPRLTNQRRMEVERWLEARI